MGVNSKYGDTVNQVLTLSGQGSIAEADFGIRTNLTRFQVQAKAFVDLANRMLLVDMNDRFAQDSFDFTTQANINSYPLSSNISSESLLWHSFFLSTPGAAVPLYNWDYREFRTIYPDPTIVVPSRPRYWILIPPDSEDASLQHRVMFFPIPDAVYTIEYQAKLNSQPLANYEDLLLFPPEYEHVLWLYGRLFLEQALGEGKESNIEMYAQKAVDAVKARATGPIEERNAVRPGMKIRGLRRGGVRRIYVYPISR